MICGVHILVLVAKMVLVDNFLFNCSSLVIDQQVLVRVPYLFHFGVGVQVLNLILFQNLKWHICLEELEEEVGGVLLVVMLLLIVIFESLERRMLHRRVRVFHLRGTFKNNFAVICRFPRLHVSRL